MNHLDADEVLDAAQQRSIRVPGRTAEHLRECPRCQDRVTAMVRLTAASEALAQESASELVVPPFERVRAAMPARTGSRPEIDAPARAEKKRNHWSPGPYLRLAAALVWAQLSLLPRFLAPVSALGFAGAVLLATSLSGSSVSTREHVFGTVVILIVLIGALTTYSGGRDPRTELQSSLPISPPTVFLCRVVGVLAIDMVLAVLGSVAVHTFGGVPSLSAVLASWFGQALLTVGVALVFAVAHRPSTGTVIGVLVWMLGSSSALPTADQLLPLHSVISALWTSSPAVLALSVVLLVIATLWMRSPQLDARQSGS